MRQLAFTLITGVSLLSVLTAQVQHRENISDTANNWSHATSSSDKWTDDVTLTGSRGGKVDRLDSGTNAWFSRKPLILAPGTYVFTARFQKFKDQTGAAPITAQALGAGIASTSTLPIFTQKTGQWMFTPGLVFTVKSRGPVLLSFGNRDTKVTKQNYYFDQITVGKVPEGDCLHYHSLTHSVWSSVHGSPFHIKNNADKDSAFGEVNLLSSVWWMEFRSFKTNAQKQRDSYRYVLQPGTYTWNVRMQRNATTTTGKVANFELWTAVGGAAFTKRTWNGTNWPNNEWFLSPNNSFVVTKKDTVVDFRIFDKASTLKRSYLFDAFVLRQGAFDPFGTGCSTANGVATLRGVPGKVGGKVTATATNVDTSVIFAAGAPLQKPVDLGSGCNLYVTPTVLVPAKVTNKQATVSIDVPNDTALKGLTLGGQAATLGIGGVIATTNAATIVIG